MPPQSNLTDKSEELAVTIKADLPVTKSITMQQRELLHMNPWLFTGDSRPGAGRELLFSATILERGRARGYVAGRVSHVLRRVPYQLVDG